MIPAQPSVALELYALCQMLGIAPADARHVLVDGGTISVADLAIVTCLTVEIPAGRALLLTHLNIESYPVDDGGIHVFGARQQGGFVDGCNMIFFLGGTAINNTSLPYRNYTGSIWLPFGKGTLAVKVKPGSLGTAITEEVSVTASGFLLPEALLPTLNEIATTRL